MNYRKNSGKLRALTALCAALAVLAVGLGAWAVVSQVRLSKLGARVAELEANQAVGSGSVNAALDYDPDTVVAEFEGGVVTAGEAVPEYQTLAAYYDMLGVAPEDYAEDAKMTVLSGLVETKVLELKAQELGLGELTDEERARIEAQAEADYGENVSYYAQFRVEEGKTEEQAREEAVAYLAENGYTLEGAVEEALQNATQQRLFDYVTDGMEVSDEQLRAFYEEQLTNAELTYTADFSMYEQDVEAGSAILWHPEGVRRVQAILIPFDEEQSVEYLSLSAAVDGGDEAKRAELDALYNALEPEAQAAVERLNGGEDFDALLAEYGSYGPVTGSCVSDRSTLYGESFRDAALALGAPGDVSGIVRTDGGLCILRYVEDVTPGPVPYEQVAQELRSGYAEELKLSAYNAAVVQWIADANPQYYTDRL